MTVRPALILALVAGTLLAFAAPALRPVSVPADGVPELQTAVSSVGRPTVGPLFHGTSVHGVHSCTASVIDSPRHDLILTAAHCVRGTGTDIVFAPGFRDGRTPYGVWRVTESYADPSWLSDQDPHDDYAVLRVSADGAGTPRAPIQSVTGGTPIGRHPDTLPPPAPSGC
ncbi:MAG TPA: trypsin-like serine protease [Flexivirga sp.]|uniref:trypsin-like serine peptidase n=1 Tax=Flexivirga sp. TaxID=1962927 RepID=UPI002CA4BAAB|nr:trypsin-like serine protease [Flexivirga sp.]HWC24610.1 trypsin-like serine protease [Flexivirga sp.]